MKCEQIQRASYYSQSCDVVLKKKSKFGNKYSFPMTELYPSLQRLWFYCTGSQDSFVKCYRLRVVSRKPLNDCWRNSLGRCWSRLWKLTNKLPGTLTMTTFFRKVRGWDSDVNIQGQQRLVVMYDISSWIIYTTFSIAFIFQNEERNKTKESYIV